MPSGSAAHRLIESADGLKILLAIDADREGARTAQLGPGMSAPPNVASDGV
jgi:hypothetical protein